MVVGPGRLGLRLSRDWLTREIPTGDRLSFFVAILVEGREFQRGDTASGEDKDGTRMYKDSRETETGDTGIKRHEKSRQTEKQMKRQKKRERQKARQRVSHRERQKESDTRREGQSANT